MRHVVAYVEGSKDAYFLHELILQKFSLFSPSNNVAPRSPSKPLVLTAQDGSLSVKIFWTDGFANLKNLTRDLRRPKVLAPTDEFVSAIIFDSDMPPTVGANIHCAGQRARRTEIHRLLGLADAADDVLAKVDKWIFLFPDNVHDGDLEDVLLGAVSSTAAHSAFFERCWRPFADTVAGIPANRPTDKSMMNEYKAAFNETAWEKNGLNLCYGDATLWNWESSSLDNLVGFLTQLLQGPASDTLDRFLP